MTDRQSVDPQVKKQRTGRADEEKPGMQPDRRGEKWQKNDTEASGEVWTP